MSGVGAMRAARRGIGPTVPVLILISLVLAYGSRLAPAPAFAVALLGVGAGLGLRAARRPILGDLSPVPVLVVLGILAAETPIAPVAELLVGAVGVVFVAWLADDPSRPPAGVARGAAVWAIPGLGVALAWVSEFLLPSSAAPLGVAGGLLAASLLVLAYLVTRPELFEREGAPTI
jgi:hypothetical protein